MRIGVGGIFEVQEKCFFFMLVLGFNILGVDDDKKINNIILLLLNIYICKCIFLYKIVCVIRYYSGFMGFDYVINSFLYFDKYKKMIFYFLNIK